MQMATLAEGDTASPSEVVGYRYPPFLHSNYGRIGPKDYTNLTEPDEDLESREGVLLGHLPVEGELLG